MTSFKTQATPGAGIMGIYGQLGVKVPKRELAGMH